MQPAPSLRLVPTAGPPIAVIGVDAGRATVLGRSATCDRQLPDGSVSRRHASVVCQDGTWLITDLESSAGVLVNALPIEPGTPTPLSEQDLVGIGPWTLRVRLGAETGLQTMSVAPDRLDPGERVDAVPARELGQLARRRLDLLIDGAARINASTDERALAEAVLEAACQGTGFPRGAIIREADDGFLVLASISPDQTPAEDGGFSRTLIDAASRGQIARLSQDATPAHGESIARLGIQAALCAPIFLGEAIDAYLYLDDRRLSATVHDDAGAFCQALCRIGGLALANLRRAALERVNAEIMRDVGAAAEAQRLLMPPPSGTCGGVGYSVRMEPGRFVAGDLFNIFELEDGRTAVYLGDVAGKGVGAAILMATTQTMLNAALRSTGSPALALDAVGRELVGLLPGGRFISLWVGVIDPRNGEVTFVDAGHGHWYAMRAGGAAPERISVTGGYPLGIDADTAYTEDRLELSPGGRLVLFSDGVAEQVSAEGDEFGDDRIARTLSGCASPRDDTRRLFDAVVAHARTTSLDDDVTIASVSLDA